MEGNELKVRALFLSGSFANPLSFISGRSVAGQKFLYATELTTYVRVFLFGFGQPA